MILYQIVAVYAIKHGAQGKYLPYTHALRPFTENCCPRAISFDTQAEKVLISGSISLCEYVKRKVGYEIIDGAFVRAYAGSNELFYDAFFS